MTSEKHYHCLLKKILHVWCETCLSECIDSLHGEFTRSHFHVFPRSVLYPAVKITACLNLEGWCVPFCMSMCVHVCVSPANKSQHITITTGPLASLQTPSHRQTRDPPSTPQPPTRTEQMPLSTSTCPDGHRKKQCDQHMVGYSPQREIAIWALKSVWTKKKGSPCWKTWVPNSRPCWQMLCRAQLCWVVRV